MLKRISNFLYKRFGIYKRDIFVFLCFIALFFLGKDFILNKYFDFYKQSCAEVASEEIKSSYETLVKENEELKRIIQIKETIKCKFVTGKVVTNIFSRAEFFVSFNSSVLKEIKLGMPVWCIDKVTGKRLLGFVADISNAFIKVRPITHHKSKFSVSSYDGVAFLLRGNGHDMSVVLANSDDCKQNEKLYYKDLFVGFYYGDFVECPSFARIKWVCIYI